MNVSESIAWDANGLVPGIVQDARDGQVRMLGYLNAESLQLTIETGLVHFYSRSRQRIWKKGESSGHVLELVSVTPDCDGDTLLIQAIPHGPTCHTGAENCFFSPPIAETGRQVPASVAVVEDVAAVVRQRRAELPEGSYTTYLFEQGIDKVCKKIGEEAAEVIIDAKNGRPERIASESADLLYHLLVLLEMTDTPLETVWEALAARRGGAEADR
jgi:phosphoribosyl-ATP pyrophosphohydrolase/phosphoribosyl-AMP cyclohydrolase